jgi:hypothetical protein
MDGTAQFTGETWAIVDNVHAMMAGDPMGAAPCAIVRAILETDPIIAAYMEPITKRGYSDYKWLSCLAATVYL